MNSENPSKISEENNQKVENEVEFSVKAKDDGNVEITSGGLDVDKLVITFSQARKLADKLELAANKAEDFVLFNEKKFDKSK